jgi:hypothetical protein
MTNEKICPIMSCPSQGNSVKLYSDKPLFESEDEMKKYGWTPLNGKPYGDVVLCQRDKCMSWETTSACCDGEGDECDDCEDCYDEYQPDCKHYVVEAGFCKLIEGSDHA